MKKFLLLLSISIVFSCSDDSTTILTKTPELPPNEILIVIAGGGTNTISLTMRRTRIDSLLGKPVDTSSAQASTYIKDDVKYWVKYTNSYATRIEIECSRFRVYLPDSGEYSDGISYGQNISRMKSIYGTGRRENVYWYYDDLGLGFRQDANGLIQSAVIYKPIGVPDSLDLYKNKKFSIRYPESWKAQENDSLMSVLISNNTSASFQVSIDTIETLDGLTPALSTDSIGINRLSVLNKDTSVSQVSHEIDTIGSFRAVRFDYLKSNKFVVTDFFSITEYKKCINFIFVVVKDSLSAYQKYPDVIKKTFALLDTTVTNKVDSGNGHGLVAYYPLDGDAKDNGPHGFNGTINGAVSSTDRFLNANKAMKITGNQYIKLDGNSIARTGDFTFSCWIKFDQFNSASITSPGTTTPPATTPLTTTTSQKPVNSILSLSNATSFHELTIGYDASAKRFQGIIDSSVTISFDTLKVTKTGTWFHWTMVRQGNQCRLYINGVQAGSSKTVSNSLLSVGKDGFIIGQDQDSYGGSFSSNQTLNGCIDELYIFSRALSSTEITDMFNEQRVSIHTPVVTAMKDTTVNYRDSILLSVSVTDSIDSAVVVYWASDGKNYKDSANTLKFHTILWDTGNCTILVKVKDNAGYISRPDTVHVYVNPLVPYIVSRNDTAVIINMPVTINVTAGDSNGVVKKYFWALDGVHFNDSTESGVLKTTFSDTGWVTIGAKVRDSDGFFSKSVFFKVRVNSTPSAATLSVSTKSTLWINDRIVFKAVVNDSFGIVSRYYWALDGIHFNDSSTVDSIGTTFKTDGIHTVALMAKNKNGVLSQPALVSFTIHKGAPSAQSIKDTVVLTNKKITLSIIASDSNGTIKRYFWALDGVTYTDSTTANSLSSTFSHSGQYTICVKVRDDDGVYSEPVSFVVMVKDCAPEVLLAGPSNAWIFDRVVFHAPATDSFGTVVKYYWAKNGVDFNDSTTADSLGITFSESGTRNVSVKVRNDRGIFSSPVSGEILIMLGKPLVQLRADTSVSIYDSLFLRGTATDSNGTVEKYLWAVDNLYFKDTTAENRLKYAFSDTGMHHVYLKVIDDDAIQSAVDTLNLYVRLDPPVMNRIHDTVVEVTSTALVSAVAHDPNGAVVKYYWDLQNDGWDDSTSTSTYNFTWEQGGRVAIRVGVRDDDGLFAYDTFSVLFNRKPATPVVTMPVNGQLATGAILNISDFTYNVPFTFSGTDPDFPYDTLTLTLMLGKTGSSQQSVYNGRNTSYTAERLDSATEYSYTLIATDLNGDTSLIKGTFTTPVPQRVMYGETVQGTLNAGGKETYYFTADIGDSVSVKMQRLSGSLYPVIKIVAPDGTLILNQSTSTSTTVSAFDIKLPSKGTYTIHCDQYSQAGSGTFDMKLFSRSEIASEASIITYRQTVVDSLSTWDLDAFKFSGSANDSISIKMQRLSGTLYPAIKIAAPNGTLILNQSTSTSTTTAAFDVKLPLTGVYTIYCEQYSQSGSGSYDMKLYSRSKIKSEAPVITYGQTVVESLGTWDLDAFKFSGSANDSISIKMQRLSGTLYPAIKIAAPNGTLILNQSTSTSTTTAAFDVKLPLTGVYTIYCEQYSQTGSGSYDMKLYSRSKIASDASTVKYGQTVVDSLSSWDLDALKFSGSANDSISIKMQRLSGTLYPAIKIAAPNGTLILNQSTSTSTTTAAFDVKLPLTGVYTIYCEQYSQTGSGSYDMKLYSRSKIKSEAPVITYGQTVIDSLDTWDLDAYKFNANANDTISVQMKITSGNANPLLKLVGPDGSLLSQAFSSTGTTATINKFRVPVSGTLVIYCESYNTSEYGNYQMTLSGN